MPKSKKNAVKQIEKALVKTVLSKKNKMGKKKSKVSLPMSSLAAGFGGGGGGTLHGSGGYFGDLWKSLKSNALAPDKVAKFLTGGALKLLGMGDYDASNVVVDDSKIESNSMCNGTQSPTIANRGQAFIMRHKEYVIDITSSQGFTLTSYMIDPADVATFPWLAAVAPAFEEYQILGMVVQYRPLISAADPNGNSSGAVMIATEYNSTKPNFTTKTQMENYEYAVSCAPYRDMLHAIECAPSETTVSHKQILIGGLPPNQDRRIYTWGNLQVATQGQATSGVALGELHISFEIAFFKPLYSIGQGLSLLTDFYSGTISNAGATNNVLSLMAPIPGHGSLLETSIVQYNVSGLGNISGIQFPVNISEGIYQIVITLAPPSGGWTLNAGSIQLITNNANRQNLINVNAFPGSPVVWYSSNEVAYTVTLPISFETFVIIQAPGGTQSWIPIYANGSGYNFNGVPYTIMVNQVNASVFTGYSTT
jgi:hypothetical protein